MECLLQAGVVKQEKYGDRACNARIDASKKEEARKLAILSRVLSILAVLLVIANTTIVGIQYIGGEEWEAYFPIPKSPAVTIPATVVWYFAAYGWSLSTVFVCLPTYVLTLRAKEYVAYIEDNIASFDVEQVSLHCDL
jgi:hypothetical protein